MPGVQAVRRLSLDLTGLPPEPDVVEKFLADASPDATEKFVDQLLSSPRYGERMAQKWLDLARYADTNGYHIDNHRDMWRYREWVIEAFNRNLPFDQFTIEQIEVRRRGHEQLLIFAAAQPAIPVHQRRGRDAMDHHRRPDNGQCKRH